MKIVCDRCGARYGVADEKIAGRLVKIRCKRCAEIVLVRPSLGTPEDAIWHVAVGGADVGPRTPSEIGRLLSGGAIDPHTYVWREGFEDWRRLGEIDELGSFARAGGPTEAHEASASASAPRTGSRSEDSVLFSLQNLRDLGTRSAAPSSKASDGSGVIDIRALISAREPERSSPGALDDLVTLGGSAALAYVAPVIALSARNDTRRLLVALFAVAVALVAVTAGLAFAVLERRSGRRGPSAIATAALPAEPGDPPGSAGTPPFVPTVATPTGAEGPAEASRPAIARTAVTPARTRRSAASRSAPETAPSDRAMSLSPPATDFERMLREALRPATQGVGPASPAPPPGPVLADLPTRAVVSRALGDVAADVRHCGAGLTGVARTAVTFAGSGAVTSVRVIEAPFSSSPVGPCIEQAVRSARVPAFARPALTVEFPFVMR